MALSEPDVVGQYFLPFSVVITLLRGEILNRNIPRWEPRRPVDCWSISVLVEAYASGLRYGGRLPLRGRGQWQPDFARGTLPPACSLGGEMVWRLAAGDFSPSLQPRGARLGDIGMPTITSGSGEDDA